MSESAEPVENTKPQEKPNEQPELVDDDALVEKAIEANENGDEVVDEDDSEWDQYRPITSPDKPMERDDIFNTFAANYFRLKSVRPRDALYHVCMTINDDLKGQRWLAEVQRSFPIYLNDYDECEYAYCTVTWIVEVRELVHDWGRLTCACKFVTLADAEMDREIPDECLEDVQKVIIPDIVEDIQSAEFFDLGQVKPILTAVQDAEDELSETIMEAIDFRIYLYKYFLSVLHRDYDLEDEQNETFLSRLKNRLVIFLQQCNQKIPYANLLRYDKISDKYDRIQQNINYNIEQIQELEEIEENAKHLPEYHDSMQELAYNLQLLETEKSCLVEKLKFLESTQLTCCGPRRPKRSRVPNGTRGRPVSHVMSGNGCINAALFQSIEGLDPQTEFQVHEDLKEATDNLHEGETVFIRGSRTTPVLSHLHDLNESNVVIEGCGAEEVIIGQVPDDDIFVCTSGDDIVLRNLTFISSADNTDGILRVERGHTIVENCIFNCNNAQGIIVESGAYLTIKNCEINDCPESAAIIQEPGARVKCSGLQIERCLSKIEVQTYPQVELPELVDCTFSEGLGPSVIVRRLGGFSGDAVDEIVVAKDDEEEKQEVEEQQSESKNDAEIADTQAAGENIQSKQKSEESGRKALNAKSLADAKEWLQEANIKVNNDTALQNIGRIITI